MKGRNGMQAKMTASYVAITAGAVLIAEIVIIGVAALSSAHPLPVKELQARAQVTATGLAAKLAATAGGTGGLPKTALGDQAVNPTPGLAQPDKSGGVVIPETSGPGCVLAPSSFAVAVSPAGRVIATSYPGCYTVGGTGAQAEAGAPTKMIMSFAPQAGGSGTAHLPSGTAVWAAAPILAGGGTPPKGTPAANPAGKSPGQQLLGDVYVEVPAVARSSGGISVSWPLILAGLLALGLSIPVGIVFGLLSTRRLTRRLKRLTASTLEVAGGAFEQRIPVAGHDELAQLEENFNAMAERLHASLDTERKLAAANARHKERSRIARELHDSISQDLFSLSVLAGGLRRALPPGSPVLPEVATMERTASETMREMQALLLELRPMALDEVGLPAALAEICRAYRDRLGIDVQAEVESVGLSPALEHAVLRVTQEAIANSVKHSAATSVHVRLRGDDNEIVLRVTDDGCGFDVAQDNDGAGGGLGLRVMRDRVTEHGGELAIESASGHGTAVTAMFPRRLS
jgi:signal transduction histidine kinase